MDTRRQHLHRLRFVTVLAATVLAFGHDAGGKVSDAHRRVGLVDVLTTGAAGAVGVNAQVGRVDLDRHGLVGFGQHGDGAGTGVDASLGLGGRHALHPVAARLKAQPAVNAHAQRVGRPFDAQHHLLVATQLRGRLADDFAAPAATLGVTRVHAKQVGSKQRRFVTAGTGAQLQKSRPGVVRVFGYQHSLQRLVKPADVGFGRSDFVLGHG